MSASRGGGCLVLRLAGPMQSWGGQSQFNRRDTRNEPTKSGLIGLLAAAQGRRRTDPIEDLITLDLGIRTDRAGSLLRDYHTVSDFRGRPLLSASVTTRGVQKPTAPAKHTGVTQRFYLQDAVFVAAIYADTELIAGLAAAVRAPAFPLALGRRACVPTQPLIISGPADGTTDRSDAWHGRLAEVLAAVPWQAPAGTAQQQHVDLPVTLDDPDGDDVFLDVPTSFTPGVRRFTSRRVRHDWVRVATGAGAGSTTHDPFALLGW